MRPRYSANFYRCSFSGTVSNAEFTVEGRKHGNDLSTNYTDHLIRKGRNEHLKYDILGNCFYSYSYSALMLKKVLRLKILAPRAAHSRSVPSIIRH